MKEIEMKVAVFLLCVLFLVPSVSAQDGKVSIAPCLPNYNVVGEAHGVRDDYGIPLKVAQYVPLRNLRKLSGEKIDFVGYGDKTLTDTSPYEPEISQFYRETGYMPKVWEWQEWHGVEAGFGGIDMTNYGKTVFAIEFFSNRVMVARVVIQQYNNDYILFVTTTYQYGLADGSRYDYHGTTDPRGGACIFMVSENKISQMMGW